MIADNLSQQELGKEADKSKNGKKSKNPSPSKVVAWLVFCSCLPSLKIHSKHLQMCSNISKGARTKLEALNKSIAKNERVGSEFHVTPCSRNKIRYWRTLAHY